MQRIQSISRTLLVVSLALALAACSGSAAPTNSLPTAATGVAPFTDMPTIGATQTAGMPATGATQTTGMPVMDATPAMGATPATTASATSAMGGGTTPTSGPTPTSIDLSQYPNGQLLANTEWLAAHLNDPSVRILDIRSHQEYQQGHIPNAVNIPVTTITTTINNVPFMFDRRGVQEELDNSGLTPDMIAVIYDNLGMLDASRMFWTLEYVGHKDARILDGGWNAWNADKRPVSRDDPSFQATQYPIKLVSFTLITAQELLQHLHDPSYAIVDARSPQEYSGEVLESARGGHIPGAVNLTWLNDLSGGHLVYTTQPNWQAVLQGPAVEVLSPPVRYSRC